jgi:hypothetical protein
MKLPGDTPGRSFALYANPGSFPTPGENESVQMESEQNRTLQPEGGPEKPPEREPGDAFVIAGAIIGLILGGTVGFFVSYGIGGLIIAILATGGGVLLGGSVGAFLGQRMKETKNRSKSGNDDASG